MGSLGGVRVEHARRKREVGVGETWVKACGGGESSRGGRGGLLEARAGWVCLKKKETLINEARRVKKWRI